MLYLACMVYNLHNKIEIIAAKLASSAHAWRFWVVYIVKSECWWKSHCVVTMKPCSRWHSIRRLSNAKLMLLQEGLVFMCLWIIFIFFLRVVVQITEDVRACLCDTKLLDYDAHSSCFFLSWSSLIDYEVQCVLLYAGSFTHPSQITLFTYPS